MKLQRHLHKKASSKSALTPQPNPLQTRPFAPPREVSPDLQTQRKTAEPVGHNFANIPLFAPAIPPIQTKLTIGEPGDKYEQEADRVAEQVVRQINTSQSPQLQQEQSLQRQEMPEDEEEELQMKPEVGAIQRLEMPEDEEEELQMKPEVVAVQRLELPDEEEQLMQPMLQRKLGGREIAAPSELETSIQQSRGSGLPISETIREPMEQSFGADFSGVKIHTDTQSDQLNRSIQARAFTTGQDIFFRQGAYDPKSRGGQELIAHELTHVVQQNSGVVQRQSKAYATSQQMTKLHQVGAIQRGVWKEKSKNSVDVPQRAKSHANWVISHRNNLKNERLMMIGGLAVNVYDKFKNKTYVGNRVFNNNSQPDSHRLPTLTTYTEWDIHEYTIGTPRGTERVVISAEGRKYYTNNHYADFTEFQ